MCFAQKAMIICKYNPRAIDVVDRPYTNSLDGGVLIRSTDSERKLNKSERLGKAHPHPLLEPVDPGGGGQGEGGWRAHPAEQRPRDAAARGRQEHAGEGEHAAGDGHAARQDQQDVGHAGQVEGEGEAQRHLDLACLSWVCSLIAIVASWPSI